MRNTLLALLLALTSITISANDWPVTSKADIELAKRYNDLINTGKIQEAKSLISPEVEFSDPTWGAHGKDKAHLVEAFDPKYTKNYHNLQYLIRNVFTSKGTVVIHMIASADVGPNDIGDPAKRVSTVIDLIRVIEIKDSMVIRQIDLADYDSAMPPILSAGK